MPAINSLIRLRHSDVCMCREAEPHLHISRVWQLTAIPADVLLQCRSDDCSGSAHKIPRGTKPDKVAPFENAPLRSVRILPGNDWSLPAILGQLQAFSTHQTNLFMRVHKAC